MDAAADPPASIADAPAGAVAVPPSAWTGNRGEPTRLLLLRHGQTELSVQRRYSGRGNPELTDTGRRQADAAARYLAERGGIAAVITSPLQRAYDTAAAAAKALGLDVAVDEDLIETDFGAWEGKTFLEAARTRPGPARALAARHHPAPAGRGELRRRRASDRARPGPHHRRPPGRRPCWWSPT